MTMNRGDFQKMAKVRLEDAQTLFKQGRYSGAYYLSGYTVECGLKACIAKQTRRFDFPPERKIIDDIYTHNFDRLVRAAGLEATLTKDLKSDEQLDRNWALVKDWKEKSRYEEHSEKKARDFLDAVTDGQHGVLQWLKQRW